MIMPSFAVKLIVTDLLVDTCRGQISININNYWSFLPKINKNAIIHLSSKSLAIDL